jgi:hypothetical protein
MDVKIHVLLTSTLVGIEWSDSRRGLFIEGIILKFLNKCTISIPMKLNSPQERY